MLHVELSGNDVIINDNTIIKEKNVKFENKTYEAPFMKIAAIVQECPVYSRITILGKLYQLSDITKSMKRNQPFREGKIIDDSNTSRSITFFESHMNEVENNKVYKITDVLVSKYDGKKF